MRAPVHRTAPPHPAVTQTVSEARTADGLIGDTLALLEALERLGGLVAAGLLTQAEFDAQKALLLAQPRPDAPLDPRSRSPNPSPSLVGRLFHWKFLPIGLVAGLALSFGAQPDETIRFFDQALSLVGT